MKKLTLGQIVEGIRKRDNRIIASIYKEIFPKVNYHIVNNGGTSDDAKDVFQESIIVVFRQIQSGTFEIKTDFEGYVFGIARLIWLKTLRNRNIHERNVNKMDVNVQTDHPADEIIEEEMEMSLFRKYFLKLGKECQKVLKMVTDGVPYEKIAKEMGYKSEKIVRNRKYKCKESLIEMIKADPDYQRLMNQRKNS